MLIILKWVIFNSLTYFATLKQYRNEFNRESFSDLEEKTPI
jgi:hypothetical protein